MDELCYPFLRQSRRNRNRFRLGWADGLNELDRDFRCIHCRRPVSAAPLPSGVKNRNHCPYCLHSRHLDLYRGGDRLAACREAMQPVGLTVKVRRTKYGSSQPGELMLIHTCVECGRISINRIAADDDPETMLAIFQDSLNMEGSLVRRLECDGIRPLRASDRGLICARLFGSSEETTFSCN
jgi:hypothetical protein